MFPVSALLYTRKRYIEELPKEEDEKEENTFMTKLELAVKMITNLTLPSWIHLTVITDGSYAQNKPFGLALLKKGIDVLGRLRKDAKCYLLPQPQSKKRRRGRPKTYGEKIDLEEMASNKSLFSPYTLFLYGKQVITQIASQIVILKGWDRPILLVIAIEKRGKREEPIFLFTTDLSLSPAKVVELYAPRWKIEILFRELKQEGGMADYMVRSKQGIERHVTISFVAQSFLQLLSVLDVKELLSVGPILRPWYITDHLSLSQVRLMIQQQCILNLFLQLLLKLGRPCKNYEVILVFNEFINGHHRVLDPHYNERIKLKVAQNC